jgi:uncharacterized oxidoreductase|tara:strand:- start:9817 stop:10893 length:1077 start_codon:yes stop_codon:yes gene_type:complete
MKNYNPKKFTQFVTKIFQKTGSNNQESFAIADHLVDSNLVGHDSHGVIRVSKYIEWLNKGNIKINQSINIIKEENNFVHIDGNFGYGQPIAKQSFDLGIKKAKENGHCLLAIKNLGHIGRVGAWAELTAKNNCVSILFVNTSGFGILMAPQGGTDRRLSANPISIGVPLKNNDYIVLDMATSSVSEGKIMVAKNKNIKLSEGLILDGYGKPTNDPEKFYKDPVGSILPFGGHKGFALAFMIDILSGSLTGGHSSHPDNDNANTVINNTFAILVDINKTVTNDYFYKDIHRLSQWVKDSPKSQDTKEILLPGEIEKNIKKERLQNGIPLDDQTIKQIRETAISVGMNEVGEDFINNLIF